MNKMEPRIFAITLGVDDLERALRFYRDGLGLPTEGIIGTEFAGSETEPAGAAAMFKLRGGLTLSIYPRSELAKDAGCLWARLPLRNSALVIWRGTEKEVDALLKLAEAAGATVIGTAHERPWGIYSGYFRDPDGHLWELVWGPQFQVQDE